MRTEHVTESNESIPVHSAITGFDDEPEAGPAPLGVRTEVEVRFTTHMRGLNTPAQKPLTGTPAFKGSLGGAVRFERRMRHQLGVWSYWEMRRADNGVLLCVGDYEHLLAHIHNIAKR